MPFVSRAQQRFAFATGQPWAERWAEETPSFADLPQRKRAKKALMRRQQSGMKAEIAERIAGELCRAVDGRYVSCSSPEATAESKRALRRKARKLERQQEQADSAVAIAENLGLEADALGAFYRFADRDNPVALTNDAVEPLRSLGLVQIGDDGNPRITPSGRSFLDAARNGDEARARDAIARGSERAKARDEKAKAKAEQEEKKKGGGGGGGKKPQPTAEEKLLEKFREDFASITDAELEQLEKAGLIMMTDTGWRLKPKSATKADSPAPPKDRIRGSSVNKPGSASGAGSGRDIEITEAVETALRNKMQAHNEANDESGKRATMGMLRSVWRRGAGAFSVSHRPGMTRQQWAMARVNAFLTLLRRGRPENAAYVSDNDLLPEDHPKSTRRSATKAQESWVPPASVRAAARRALEVREEAAPSNRGMTPVGLARARDLMNGRPVSEQTLRRMKAYFDRHEVDKMGSTWDERGKGWQAWYGWGGDAGRSWANGILRRLDAEDDDAQKAQTAQQRAIHAKLGGGGGGGGAAGGGAAGGAAATQQWATGKDGKRHPTEEQKRERVAALTQKRDQLREKANGAPEGSRQRLAASRAAAKLDGKIRDTESRPALSEVNARVEQRRSERLQAQADRARRAADSGQMTPAQAERARQRADNLEARAKGQPVPHKRNAAPAKPAVDIDTQIASATSRIRELENEKSPIYDEMYAAQQSLRRTKNPERLAELRERVPRLEAQYNEVRARLTAAESERNKLYEEKQRQKAEADEKARLAAPPPPPPPGRPAGAPPVTDYDPRLPDNHPDARLDSARILRLQADSGYDRNGPLTDEQRSRFREMADRQVILHDVERNPKFTDVNPSTLPPINAASDRQRQYAEDMRRKRVNELSNLRRQYIYSYNELSRREPASMLQRRVASVDASIARALQNTDARFWIDFPLQTVVLTDWRRAQAADTASKLVDDLDLELYLTDLEIQLATLKGQA